MEWRRIADLERADVRDVGIGRFYLCRWARRIFQFGRNRCVWKSADDVVADGQRRLPIWKEIAYLIQGSTGDIVTDGDSVGRWNGQICSDSDSPGLARLIFNLQNLFLFRQVLCLP